MHPVTMIRKLKIVHALALAAALVLPLHAAGPAIPRAIMGYYESGGSYDSLVAFHSYINQLPTDTFGVNAAGKIHGNAPKAALDFAKSHSMLTFATISNFGASDFDPEIAHSILTHPAIAKQTILNLLELVQTDGYSGINIDFESIPHGDRAAFNAFMHAIAKKMRASGKMTVVSVPAEQKDDPNDSWTGAFDFKFLGKNVDVIQLMTYDQHGPWGKPGPVAGLDWVEPCVRYAASVVDSRKLSLGIPAYGYDWDKTHNTGVQLHWNKIQALIASTGATPQWDAASSSPFFDYQASDGSEHVVWYEDEKSIPLKSALVDSYNLAGVSMFALGFEDKTFWQAIHAGFKKQE
jgi:spore germination protein